MYSILENPANNYSKSLKQYNLSYNNQCIVPVFEFANT